MDRKEMKDIFNHLFYLEEYILDTKGNEYSGENNVLRNFEDLSNDINLTQEKILWIYLKKHLDAIKSYINIEKELSSETIKNRIIDARVYLGILYCMILNEKR